MFPALAQIGIWSVLWIFWFFVSGDHHPTALINAIVTTLLLATYAAGVYLNHLVLIPRLGARRPLYWGALLLVMSVLTAAVVIAIQLVYDALLGPDPRRFGFWLNFGLDFFGLALHLLLAFLLVQFLARRAGKAARTLA